MSSSGDQLALPFSVTGQQTFFNFSGRDNDEVITRLSARPRGVGVIWLQGGHGVGKSHLMRAAVHAQQGYGVRSVYLDADQTSILRELARLHDHEHLAIDNVAAWLGHRDTEEALFTLYQAFLQRGRVLLLADEQTPLSRTFVLPDLASRMRAAEVFEIRPLDENGVRLLLQRRARERGLKLTRSVLDFWLTRRNRSLTALLGDLDRLDAASWQAKHRLTVPFLKAVLGL